MSHQTYTLGAARREFTGRKARRLRKEGVAPAVLYGYRVEPTNLQLDIKEFEAIYRQAGQSALVDLMIADGRPVRVFVQEVQRHPISQALLHVDFHAVNLRQEITSEVPVVLVGTVTVHALPTELPPHLDVSIESLQEVDEAIHVSDLPTSGSFQITTDPSELVVKITAVQLEPEAEEVAEEEAAEGEQPEEGTDSDGQGTE